MDFQEIFNKAYVRSLEYLSLMPRTCSEVNKKLSLLLNNLSYTLDEEIKTEIVESVISKLTSEGLLDDTQFATTYVTQRISSSKPKSKGEIRNFLYKKGIPAHITDHALEMYTSDDEIAAIKKIIAKKNFSDKKKIKQYLYSRGFNINLIADLLSQYLTLLAIYPKIIIVGFPMIKGFLTKFNSLDKKLPFALGHFLLIFLNLRKKFLNAKFSEKNQVIPHLLFLNRENINSYLKDQYAYVAMISTSNYNLSHIH